MIVPHVGGGFGGKAGIHLEPLVACLSRKAGGRPVKLQATREEEFSLLPCRSALTYRIKTGVRSDGRITAQKMTMYWDAGAYADYAVNVTRASGYSAAGPYEIPNAWVDAYTIYTNKPYGTAYRGFGHVEFFWGLERHMELVAQADRHGPARVPPEEPAEAGLDHADRRDDHRAHRQPPQVPRGGGQGHRLRPAHARGGGAPGADRAAKIGKGLATLHKAPAMPSFTATAAVVKMNSDGTVVVNLALTEIGQGSATGDRADRGRAPALPDSTKVKVTSRRTPTRIPTTGRPWRRRGSSCPATPRCSRATTC